MEIENPNEMGLLHRASAILRAENDQSRGGNEKKFNLERRILARPTRRGNNGQQPPANHGVTD